MESWHKFWKLSGPERRVVMHAAAGLVATRAGLRLVGFQAWKSAILRLTRATPLAASVDSAHNVARRERAAARHLFFRPNCLEESLTLWWMLRKRGIAADLRVGARKEAGKFEAHAWVECGGAVLNDPDERHRDFAPFDGPLGSPETQTP